MQLGFQAIPKPNAQVIETYIGVIILKIIRHAQGLVLRLLLSAMVNWALGRLLTILLL